MPIANLNVDTTDAVQYSNTSSPESSSPSSPHFLMQDMQGVGNQRDADAEEPTEREFVGLSNQGATCYLNSLIQSLFMTPEIRNALYKWRYNEELHGSADRSIPYQLQRLFVLLEKCQRKAVQTEDLTKSFGWTSRDAFVQHDINELCRVLFDALDKTFAPNLYRMRNELSKTDNEDEKDAIRKKYENELESEYLMSDLYAGTMIDYIHAKGHFDANGKPIGRDREDKFLDLQLVVHNIGSLEESLRNYIKPEYMTGENQWRCDELDAMVDATKGFRFENFPSLLTLHLKRFDYDRRTWQPVKLSHRIEFPFELDLKEYVPENYPHETRYELFSCLIHSGSVRSGHYYAYIKNMANNKWYEFNDSNVREISIQDVEKMYGSDDDVSSYSSTNAYMLMYRRMDQEDNKAFHSEYIPDDLLQWVNTMNVKWEEERKREELRRNTLSFRVHYCDQPDLRRGGISHVDLRMLNHHTLAELKQEAVTAFAQMEKRAREMDRMTSSEDGEDTTVQQPSIWSRPIDCYRFRFLERYYRFEMGKIFTEEDVALKKNFSYETSLLLQVREEGQDWPRDQRAISVHVYFLDTVNNEFEKQISMDFDCSFTIRELRAFLASKINFRGNTYPAERVGLIKKCMPFKTIELITEENMDRLIEDVGLDNYDDIYVEILPEEGAPCMSRRLLELNEYYYILYVNHPGTNDYTIRYEAIKTETLGEMKRNISDMIGIPVNEFRMSLLNSDNTVEPPFENEHRKLNIVPRVWNNTKIHVERGHVLAPGEFMVSVYRYITEKEHFTRLELERKKRRARALKKEMEEKRALEKQQQEGDDILEVVDVAQPNADVNTSAEAAAENATTHEDAAAPHYNRTTSNDDDIVPVAPPLYSSDGILVNPQLNGDNNWPRAYSADEQKVRPHILTFSERNNLFRHLAKLVVSNSMRVSELKALIAHELLPKEVAPECIRVRVRASNTAEKVLAPDEERLKALVPKLSSSTEFAFQVLKQPDELPQRPMIVNIRQWFSATWTFSAASEMVLDTESVRSSDDFRKALAPLVDIPEEHLGVYKAPYNIEYLSRRDCGEIAILDWRFDTNNIYGAPVRLDHGETMLFRDMRHEEKQDLEKLKKKYSNYWSGYTSSSNTTWRNSSYHEPEQALRITTEFDEPITPTSTTAPEEDKVYPMVVAEPEAEQENEVKEAANTAQRQDSTQEEKTE